MSTPKQYGRGELLQQGVILIPTRLTISYRLKNVLADAKVRVYGIVRNSGTTRAKPVLLNSNVLGYDILLDSLTAGRETSQIVQLNSEYRIVDCVLTIENHESTSRVRDIVLHGRTEPFADEQEYVLG